MKLKMIALLLVLLLIISCKEEPKNLQHYVDLADNNYLVFGRIEGFCATPCSYYYAIEKNRLLLDAQKYETEEGGPYSIQPQSNFDLVKDLPNLVPQQMINAIDTFYYGNPFIADGTVYKVVYNYNGVKKLWYLNQGDSIPSFAQEFITLLDNKLTLLGH